MTWCDYCNDCMTNTQGGAYCRTEGCPNSYGGAATTRSVPDVALGRIVLRPRPDIAERLFATHKLPTSAYTGRTAKGRARRS